LLDFATALAAVIAEARLLPAERCPFDAALGRILADPVRSPENLPSFDNSAMDGFALASRGRTLGSGEEFDVHGESAAGDGHQHSDGSAFEIMTGARVPDGLDAVVPVEQVEVIARSDGRPQRIRLIADVPPGQHLRRSGEDVAAGAEVLPSGRRIDASALMLLAALGIGEVAVRRRPHAAVICTGRELVDDPSRPLQAGQIRNSNGPYLAARLLAAGADVVHRATVSDDVDAFLADLQRALAAGCDVVLSTGAVSMGRYDFVPEALARLGARVVFHKVAMRPGKPLLFAVLPDGTLYFGLPGNPVSSAVGLRFFVEPALRMMLGMSPEPVRRLPLREAARKKPGFRLLQKAAIDVDADGRAGVRLLRGQESFRIEPLLHANGWAVLAEDASELPAGSLIDVHPVGHLDPFLHGADAA